VMLMQVSLRLCIVLQSEVADSPVFVELGMVNEPSS